MSSNRARADGNPCIICFFAKRKCIVGGKPCCSRAGSDQRFIDASPCIGKDAFESSIIGKLRGWSHAQQASITNSGHNLECQPIGLENGVKYTFLINGVINLSNKTLIAQFDRMVLDTCAPKIQRADGAPKSISLACLGIGYCNMLISVKLQDNSELHNKHDLFPVLAYLAIMRLSDIIANLMKSVRNAQPELDIETRPGLILWYLYLSTISKRLSDLGVCQMLDDVELYQHVQKILTSFRGELRERLETDCKNTVHWAAELGATQRGIMKKIHEILRPWTLSLRLASLNENAVKDRSLHLYPDSYNTPHATSIGSRPKSELGLSAMGQPSPQTANGNPVFSVTSDEDSNWIDEIVRSHHSVHDSCETTKAQCASLYEDVSNDMFESICHIQESNNHPLATFHSHNGEIEWKNDTAHSNSTRGRHDTATSIAFSDGPQMPFSTLFHPAQQYYVASDQPEPYQANTNWNKDLTEPFVSPAWTNTDTSRSSFRPSFAAYSPTHNTQHTSYTSTSETGLSFDPNTDMVANLCDFHPDNPQHDDLGEL